MTKEQKNDPLKIEKVVVKLDAGLLMNALPNQESQLMAVLAGSRNTDDSLKHKREGKTNMSYSNKSFLTF